MLGLPEPRVLAQLKTTWREDRKPANVLLVLDTSGLDGRGGPARAAPRTGSRCSSRQVAPQDRVGLTTFSDEITPLVPIGPFARATAPQLEPTIDAPDRRGRHRVLRRRRRRASRPSRELARPRRRINAVVLLTDGEDTDSSRSRSTTSCSELEGQGDSRDPGARVHDRLLAPARPGAEEALERIAAASGGKAYDGDTEDIESVYRSISSFF